MKFAFSILLISMSLLQIGVVQENKNLTLQNLNLLLSEKTNSYHGQSIIDIGKKMKDQGVDIEIFCLEVLESKEFIDFQADAISLLSAEKYNSDPVFLAVYLTNYYQNGTKNRGDEYVSKVCLNHISMMVGPYLFQGEVVPIITEFYKNTFDGNQVNGHNVLAKHTPDRSVSADNIRRSGMSQRLVLGYLSLTAKLYQATGGESYKKTIEKLKRSDDPVVVNMCNFYLSDEYQKGWSEGRYELFAIERGLIKEMKLPSLSQEEIAEDLRASREARNRPPKN